MTKACKDCGSTSRRLTTPGPRCASCHRVKREVDAKRRKEKRMADLYGLKPGEFDKLMKAQNNACAICLQPFTKTRMPDLDHSHETGYARGILCKSDNRKVLPYAKDDPKRLRRAAEYLEDPPAQRVLGLRKAED